MRVSRTGFVAQSLDRHFAGPGEVDAQDLAAELVEVHVVDGVLCVCGGGKGHEAIALVLFLWQGEMGERRGRVVRCGGD